MRRLPRSGNAGLDAVATAAAAVTFPSSTSFCWLGIEEVVNPPGSAATPARRGDLRSTLARRLYHSFYLRGEAVGTRTLGMRGKSTISPPGVTASFEAALSAANRGRRSLEPGWRLEALAGGDARMVRAGLTVHARREDIRADPCVGRHEGRVALRLPRERLGVSPGFYVALGDFGLDLDDHVLRVYWNVRASGALPLVAAVTELLNRRSIPFQLKVRNDPDGFDRCDAAVLYVRQGDAPGLAPLVREIQSEIAPRLKPMTPVFTQRVAPGIGLAEQPPGPETFGQHRCRLLAEGLLRARDEGAHSLARRVAIASERFGAGGIRLDLPHLNPGSRAVYAFPPARSTRTIATRRRPGGAGPPRDRSGRLSPEAGALEVAGTIGRRLLDEAIWDANRCTWVAWQDRGRGRRQAARSQRVAALAPDLYAGAAGVALFLAELHVATGDRAAGLAAVATTHHALDRMPTRRDAESGLYAGNLGVALAAARVGVCLGEESLVERAAAVVEGYGGGRPPRRYGLDLVSGRAGDVIALLALSALLEDDSLAGIAADVGDELAERAAHGTSREESPPVRPRALTGLAHGMSGVGWALMELYSRTDDERYADGASRAFGFERRWFDERAGNWADLRLFERARGRPPGAVGWCHGACGIALSRLRAHELSGSRVFREEAEIALRTTAAKLEQELVSGTGDFSLCHGMTGLGTALLEGSRVLGEDVVASAPVRRLADAGLDLRALGEPWPCATRGEHPGLITGLAGIGWFYLRLHDPTIPSVLLVQPEAWAPLTPALQA